MRYVESIIYFWENSYLKL